MERPLLFSHVEQCTSMAAISRVLKSHGLKHSFQTKAEQNEFIAKLTWAYTLPWRQEQKECLQTFCQSHWNEMIIQAIFGGGKTTMMLAMVQHLILQGLTKGEGIQICAFNVCIKNEIRKKLKFLSSHLNIQTFDSIIYHLCDELGYENMKALDFSGKRKFVQQHLSKIQPNETIQFLFVDEAQDLEKVAYDIFRKRFPNAKRIFVGDVFQSIQKEPRESMLWYFLRRPEDPHVIRYSMTNTPRVPQSVLDDIQLALSQFYPEFSSTIEQWTSSSTSLDKVPIQWYPFDSYKAVYEDMLRFIREKGATNVMILTFSSAITVRGVLGDVSRVRQFLMENHIPVNSNHKMMKDDCVFLSTANSSKGLERDYVFAFLTFPLELAFANFSDDLVVNLTTVALSRCKKGVSMYIPKFQDRFSKVLNLYQTCPQPVTNPKKMVMGKKPTTDMIFQDRRDNKRHMLEKEQSITETLRLSILSFSTRSLLKSYAKKYRSIPLVQEDMKQTPMSEEDSTFSGVVFETLTLGSWKHCWPHNSAIDGSFQHHDVFQSFQTKISSLRVRFLQFIKHRGQFSSLSVKDQVTGACLYAQLHLACFQKIFWRENASLVQKITNHWTRIRSTLQQFKPAEGDMGHLTLQHNLSMPFLTGIADAMLLPPKTSKELLEIFEIKASKASDWQDHALLQSLLYGICMGRSLFRIHLVNVYHKEVQSFVVQFKEDFVKVRDAVMTDLRQWNLNCFLSKNVTHHNLSKKTMTIQNTFFLDGNQDKQTFFFVEIVSPSKTFIHPVDATTIRTVLPQMIKDFAIQKIIVSRRLSGDYVKSLFPHVDLSIFRCLTYEKQCQTADANWQQYLQSIGWFDYEDEKDSKKTYLEWDYPQCTFMVQWAMLCDTYNMDC